MKTRNAVFTIALFAILTFVTTMALGGAVTPPSIAIYDEDIIYNEVLEGTTPKYVAAMQFDQVINESFFPRDGEVFRRSTAVFVRVSGVCTVKKTVRWYGTIYTEQGTPVFVFDTTSNAAVFTRVFYANTIDFSIQQASNISNAVGCHVSFEEID